MKNLDLLTTLDSSAGSHLNAVRTCYPDCFDRSLPTMCVVGASWIGREICECLNRLGTPPLGVYDDSTARQGETICGQTVWQFARIDEVARDVPIVLATHRVLSLRRRLRAMGFTSVWPFPLLSMSWPSAFQAHPFYEAMQQDLFANKQRLIDLSESFSDYRSKSVLDAVIGFRLTMDPEHLAHVIEPDGYFPRDIITFGDNEYMVDGGAFTGDSLETFLSRTAGKHRRAICIEPATKSFEILRSRFSALDNVTYMNACVFDAETEVIFSDSCDRDATISIEGSGRKCATVCIDRLPNASSITFIKLNIEGSESRALNGGATVIGQSSPKLAIAGYHGPHDLIGLPSLIRDLNPSYRLFLRQHDGGTIETVIYAVASDLTRV